MPPVPAPQMKRWQSERQVDGGELTVVDMGDAVSIEPKRVDGEGGSRAVVVGYDDALAVEIEIRRGRRTLGPETTSGSGGRFGEPVGT